MDRLWTLMICILISLPKMAIGQVAGSTLPKSQWWQMVAGILAIPAAILGIAYSYILIRKTKLEARKTELEIIEKEQALGLLDQTQTEIAKEFIRPLIENRKTQALLLRFVLLYVVLRLLDLVELIYDPSVKAIFIGLQKVFLFDLEGLTTIGFYLVISKIPVAIYLIVVIGLGLPLLRDLSALLNIDVKKILMPWRN